MMRLSSLLAALSLLVACSSSPPPASPVPLGGPSGVASGTVPAKRAPPFLGPAGSCLLDGLAMPLYSTDDAHWGDVTAPVAMVLFSDFECPFCARQRQALDEVKAHFGPRRVQLIWKNMPLSRHRHARSAAEAGQAVLEASGPDAFWRFHDLVFANNRSISDDQLAAWAQEAGVEPGAYTQARARPSVAAHVNGDMALAHSLGVNGTPMMIVNGVALEGLQDPSALTSLVEQMLAQVPATTTGFYACDQMRESWSPSGK